MKKTLHGKRYIRARATVEIGRERARLHRAIIFEKKVVLFIKSACMFIEAQDKFFRTQLGAALLPFVEK